MLRRPAGIVGHFCQRVLHFVKHGVVKDLVDHAADLAGVEIKTAGQPALVDQRLEAHRQFARTRDDADRVRNCILAR